MTFVHHNKRVSEKEFSSIIENLGRERIPTIAFGSAIDFLEKHRDVILGLTKSEMKMVADALSNDDRETAQRAIVAHMSVDQFREYLNKTTSSLRGIARHRADMLDLLKDLGESLAIPIGRAIVRALSS